MNRPRTTARTCRAAFGKAVLLAALLPLTLWARPAAAQAAASEIRATLARDPAVLATVQAALKHFRVHPEALDALRSHSRTRALLPVLSTGYRLDNSDFARVLSQMITNPTNINENTNTRTNSVTVGGVWDLRDLAFNPSEVQVYGLVGIQRDLILEVTRTYFLRRQLLVRLALRPPADQLARATLDLRVEEYTAILDALTGGWFSRAQRKGGVTKFNE